MNKDNEKMLKKALSEIVEKQDEQFAKEIEEANNNPLYQLKENEAADFVKEHMPKKRTNKAFLRAASIILVIIVSVTTVTLSVEGFKERFNEFVNNLNSSIFATVKITDDEDEAKLLSFEGQYAPTYIPEGYYVESVTNEENRGEIILKNKEGYSILFREQTSGIKSNLDTENADSVENVEINGMKGLLVQKDNLTTIALTTENTIIYLTCNDVEVNLVAFAEKIEKR